MSARADKLIHARFPQLTARQVDEAISRGLVRLAAGGKLKKGSRLAEDTPFDVSALERHLARLHEGNPELAIPVLASGDGFVVVDKPAGIPSHPIGLFDFATVTHWALARFPEARAEFPGAQPTLTPHRLDTGTSGCQVVALTAAAFSAWRERFQRHAVEKTYLAWAWGAPAADSFVADAPIGHFVGDPRRMVAIGPGVRFTPPARDALTRITVVRRAGDAFLARVTCETGVTHQVRVHFASLGFPLVGDRLYDPQYGERAVRPEHHCLRAVRLEHDGAAFTAPEAEFANRVPAV